MAPLGELCPRVGFIVTNLARPAERVLAFYILRRSPGCGHHLRRHEGAKGSNAPGDDRKGCLDRAKSGRFAVPVPSTAGFDRPLLALRRDLSSPEPVKGTILAPKPRESGECRF
jgi:hypothetical protein